jgi:hypothetical protein
MYYNTEIIEAPLDELIGLAYQYLFGSISFMERQLNTVPVNLRNLHLARTQLGKALEAFKKASSSIDSSSFIDHKYLKLAENLLINSHTMLETASSRLSSSLKVC